MLRQLLLSALLPLALASPFFPRQSANSTSSGNATSAPIATLHSNGTAVHVMGASNSTLGQNIYLGIPFAAPPVGNLRFAPPQNATWNTTMFNATMQPPACLQTPNNTYGMYGYSEDCLYLNVYAPETANATNATLPVMVWVYGGSFLNGAASTYDGSVIVGQGIEAGTPVIHVALNYRLGVFGFPNGAEAAANDAANLGLKDVIKALDWVHENIGAFGGDASKVTVFGESAGAILISLLYLNPKIKSFRSAIMESGAQSTAPLGPTKTQWQAVYDLLVENANCTTTMSSNGTMNANSTMDAKSTSTNQSTWDCLKALPAEQLIAAQVTTLSVPLYQGAFTFGPSVDGSLIPASPHTLLAEGKFAKIPFISGNNKDEGTAFVPTSVSNETFAAEYIDIIEPHRPNITTLVEILTAYPDVPSMGSPFDTGNNTFGLAPEYKQLAAVIGDVAFQSSRRWFLEQANSHGLTKTWSYLFTALTPGAPGYLGVYHASEVPYVYGEVLVSPNSTAADRTLSQQMIQYWLNFATFTNPSPMRANSMTMGAANMTMGAGNMTMGAGNMTMGAGNMTMGAANMTYWPAYGKNQTMLQLNQTNITTITDTYRKSQMDFFLEQPTVFNLKRSL